MCLCNKFFNLRYYADPLFAPKHDIIVEIIFITKVELIKKLRITLKWDFLLAETSNFFFKAIY